MNESGLSAIFYLAPNQLPVYQFIMEHLSRQIGHTITITTGSDYKEAEDHDIIVICGLPYVLRSPPRHTHYIDVIAAPVIYESRYRNNPIYCSDVIVHVDSDYQGFMDLRGAEWAYNEPESQSGYGITRFHMVQHGLTDGFFGHVHDAGFHQKAILMVAYGKVDAAAIDSHVLNLELRNRPDIAAKLKIIDTLGPSTSQAIAVHENLPDPLKENIRQSLTAMHTKQAIQDRLRQDFIERLAPVTDSDYDDIRHMLEACEAANFLTIQ